MSTKCHFLSYSRADDGQAIAARLVEALRAASPPIPIWWDQDLRPVRTDYDDQVFEAIRQCETFLFVMSADSVTSASECKREWSYALSCKKPILPLSFSNAVEAPPRLLDRQRISFAESFDQGLMKLRRHFAWLQTDEGRVQGLRERRVDAARDLARCRDDLKRQRIQRDLELLDEQIREYEGSATGTDPRIFTAAPATAIGVTTGPPRPARRRRVPVVNTPPGIVPSYFQGRAEQVKTIVGFLRSDTRRLLAIIGRGGMGKTSLACEALQSLERGDVTSDAGEPIVDGIVYVRCAADEISVNQLFADILRLLPAGRAGKARAALSRPKTSDKVAALLQALSGERLAILLDNFEGMVDSDRNLRNREMADALTYLLRTTETHGLKIIITSRIPPRELALVEPARYQPPIEIAGLQSPYAERVLQAMDPDGILGLNTAPEAVLKTAVERTDGNPKALEKLFGILAADRHTTLQELLESHPGSLPEEVLEVLVGEHFARLDRSTQMTLECLAIYNRPVSSDAVDFVLDPFVEKPFSLSALNRLVNMKFVQKQAGLFSLHRIDREYVNSHIPVGRPTDGERKPRPFSRVSLQLLAADHCRKVRKSATEIKTIGDLTPQLAEISLRCEAHDFDTAAKLLLEVDSEHLRKMAHYETIIDLHERLRGHLGDPHLVVKNLMHLGYAHGALRDGEASFFYERARELAREHHIPRAEADTYIMQGNQYASEGDPKAAMACYEQAVELARQEGYPSAESRCLSNCGLLYLDLGETHSALEYQDRALAIARAHELPEEAALIDLNRGEVLLASNHLDKAAEIFARTVTLGDSLGNRRIRSYGSYFLALEQLLANEPQRAAETVVGARDNAVPENAHDILVLAGTIFLCLGDVASARAAFVEAFEATGRILDRNPRYRPAHESTAVAFCGLTLCGGADHREDAAHAFHQARLSAAAGRSAVTSRGRLLLGAMARADVERRLAPVLRILDAERG